MVDAMTYEQGNMNLHPEKTSKLDLTYNIKGKKFTLFADAYFNYTISSTLTNGKFILTTGFTTLLTSASRKAECYG